MSLRDTVKYLLLLFMNNRIVGKLLWRAANRLFSSYCNTVLQVDDEFNGGKNLFLCRNVNDVYFIHPRYERGERRMLLSRLREGSVFVDVGAHVGTYVIPAAKKVGPRGRVVAVEAHPDNASILLKNVRLNKVSNVIVVNKAAYFSRTKIKLHIPYRRVGGGGRVKVPLLDFPTVRIHPTIRRVLPNGCIMESILIDAEKLDDMLNELVPRGNIDALKIDVEGATLEVLKGAPNTLRRTEFVLAEAFPEIVNEVSETLRSFNFKLLKAFPSGRHLNLCFIKLSA